MGCDMEWISVEDRLPEDNDQYLVKVPNSPFNRKGFAVSGFSKSIKPNFSYDRTHMDSVTHWMPLPNPPEA